MKVFFPILRTVEVIQIPDGHKTLMPKGTQVRITQALGNHYTIATEKGHMSRIEHKDLDALGPENVKKAEVALCVPAEWTAKSGAALSLPKGLCGISQRASNLSKALWVLAISLSKPLINSYLKALIPVGKSG